MGAISGLLGVGGGAAGTSFAAPAGTNPQQLSAAYSGVQSGLQQQQNLLNAIQGQNGLGNQSQVYQQLQGVVNGTGPNPAQAQLAQATGQNVAQQASLAAGQRGAASNVGLLARQAAQTGSQAQQQAAGQAATLQAQQSLNALSGAGNIANTQASNQIGATGALSQAFQGNQANLLNAQNNMNNANAQLANTQMQGQQALIGSLTGSSAVGSILGSGGADGGEVGTDFGNFATNAVNPGSLAPAASKPSGGGGGGGIMKLAAFMAQGGTVQAPTATVDMGPQSMFGQFVTGGVNPGSLSMGSDSGAQALTQGVSKALTKKSPTIPQGTGSAGAAGALAGAQAGLAPATPAIDTTPESSPSDGMAKGGMVSAMVSPGERILSPSDVEQVRKGADPLKLGRTVPGKAKVEGPVNSYKNDTVPAKLSTGSIVVPRSETKSKEPSKNSRDFVNKTLAKKKIK
jgi:hypothetical protein